MDDVLMCLHIYVYEWCTYVGTCATEYLWRSEDNFQLSLDSEDLASICRPVL